MTQNRRFSQAIITVLQAAITWILLFGMTGAGLLIAGVLMLYGVAWALLSAAGCCFLFSFLIMRGVSRGG
ncbi:hypothetical protein [Marinobacter sp. JSM 1782161]|uniref:hypothetical protein n=1 Tax=Marinobacter sp. JSM 1782161 TaxID=2685906 RepID=UPI00140383BE|nr:hypothetical protein [Marinobacter sp. JSM 1782161]